MKKKTTSRKIFFAFLRIAAAAWIGLLLFLYFGQSLYVYRPETKLLATPKTARLPFEDVTLTAADGMKLSAWYIENPASPGAVLFCHSNFGNMSHFLQAADFYRDLGFSVLLFDYRGYGQSEGRPSEKGTYQDAEAAWNYLRQEKKIPPEKIVIVGRSLGGAVAARLAMDHPPHALILESAFSSFPDLAQDYYPYLPVRLIARYQYPTRNYIAHVTCPVFIVHSRDDEVVPFHHSADLFAAANPKSAASVLAISGDHNDGYLNSGQDYRSGVAAFLNRIEPLRPAPTDDILIPHEK